MFVEVEREHAANLSLLSTGEQLVDEAKARSDRTVLA